MTHLSQCEQCQDPTWPAEGPTWPAEGPTWPAEGPTWPAEGRSSLPATLVITTRTETLHLCTAHAKAWLAEHRDWGEVRIGSLNRIYPLKEKHS